VDRSVSSKSLVRRSPNCAPKIAGGQQVVLLSLGATSLEEHIGSAVEQIFRDRCNR